MDMEQRLEQQKRGVAVEEITELNLDNCKASQISGLTDDFKTLRVLSLNNVGLTTLKGFPSLPELTKLELSDNLLCGTLNLLSGCPKLIRLNLSGNKIKDIEALEPLKEMAELKYLDLFNCEVTSVDGYRGKVFEMLPSVVFLDGSDRNDLEDEEEDDDDDEVDDDEDDEEGEEEEEEDEVGLSYLQKSGLEDDESDGEEFQPNGTNDDDEDDDEDESEGDEDLEEEGEDGEDEEKEVTEKSPAEPRGRGVKRKRAADDSAEKEDA